MVCDLRNVNDRVRAAVDAVSAGLATMLGAGVFTAVAPAAESAGTWLLAGLPIAALLAVACALSTRDTPGDGAADRVATVLGLAGRLVAAVAVAGSFGAYLAPGRPVLAGVVLLAVVTAVAGSRFEPPAALVRTAALVVLVVLAVFVAACVAIVPVAPAVAAEPAAGDTSVAGVLAASGLLFFCFLGFERVGRAEGRRSRALVLVTIGVTFAVTFAVAAAALHQLGAARLAASPAPLRDALAAADASALDGPLTAAAAIAMVFVLVGLFATARDEVAGLLGRDRPAHWLVVPFGAVAALGVAAVPMPTAFALASGLLLGHYLLRVSARVVRPRYR